MSTRGRMIESFQKAHRRFLTLQGTPREIALGFSLGLFVGMSPFMMCHTVTAFFIASLFKWNRIAAAVGAFITNPVTAPFFYIITFRVGGMVMPDASARLDLPATFSLDTLTTLIQEGPEILWILTVGGVVTGIPIAVAGYMLAYGLVLFVRRRCRLRDSDPSHGRC